MEDELKKKIFRFLTPKTWRRNRRKRFFMEIFRDLMEKPDGVNWGAFCPIEGINSSYEDSCREMVKTHDYNPLFDKKYGKMNLANYFRNYQFPDSLYVVIERISTPKDIILKRCGDFKVYVFGSKNGVSFNFYYDKKNVKFGIGN